MSDLTPSGQDQTPQGDPPRTISRRELLRKAGWVVPAVVVIPLLPQSAHAAGKRDYASAGKPLRRGGSDGSSDYGWKDTDKGKKKKKKKLARLLRDLFGRKGKGKGT